MLSAKVVEESVSILSPGSESSYLYQENAKAETTSFSVDAASYGLSLYNKGCTRVKYANIFHGN